MVTRSLASQGTSLLLALASFMLASCLLVDLCFMVAYFSSPVGASGWWGPAWWRFLHDVTQAGPMAALLGWAALTAGTGYFGSRLATRGRRTRAGITLASMASLLSTCGMMGAGLAALILASLGGCRQIWSM
jgi:hypothetical protein